MREILFRGKDENNVWQKGFYCAFNDKSHRIYTGFAETDCGDYYPDYDEINPETVGQYTGLSDKNGIKIFEGDIVLLCADDEPYTVGFDECCFQVYSDSICYNMDCFYDHDIEVIGNIYDNPELLGRAEK